MGICSYSQIYESYGKHGNRPSYTAPKWNISLIRTKHNESLKQLGNTMGEMVRRVYSMEQLIRCIVQQVQNSPARHIM